MGKFSDTRKSRMHSYCSRGNTQNGVSYAFEKMRAKWYFPLGLMGRCRCCQRSTRKFFSIRKLLHLAIHVVLKKKTRVTIYTFLRVLIVKAHEEADLSGLVFQERNHLGGSWMLSLVGLELNTPFLWARSIFEHAMCGSRIKFPTLPG